MQTSATSTMSAGQRPGGSTALAGGAATGSPAEEPDAGALAASAGAEAPVAGAAADAVMAGTEGAALGGDKGPEPASPGRPLPEHASSAAMAATRAIQRVQRAHDG